MMRLSYENDYSEGCLPEILELLRTTNFEQTTGYGNDPYTKSARRKIAQALAVGEDDSDIYFTSGGTLANTAVISHILRPHQGVMSAACGHINTHESGAIESCGHKVLEVEADPYTGKVSAPGLEKYLADFWADSTHEHVVQPGLLYLSNLTEFGDYYTANELAALRDVADRYNIPIFMDGARLGPAIDAAGSSLQFSDLPRLVDVFTVGGTKMGALFGEAIVFTGRHPAALYSKDFAWTLKQRGGRMAKGRLLGLQFECLFTSNLYFKAAAYANAQADKLREGFMRRQIPLWFDSKANQVFVLMDPEKTEKMAEFFVFETWATLSPSKLTEFAINQPQVLVRLCTSFATPENQADQWFATWDKI